MLWLTVAIFGVLSYTVLMQRQGFPAVDVPVSVVSGTYFAGDVQRVDRDVTKPLSRIIGELPQVDKLTTQAGDNFFSIIIEYKDGTSSQRGNQLVRQTVERSGRLPRQAVTEYRPIDSTRFADRFDILLAVYDSARPNPNIQQLEQRSRALANQLAEREGLASATVINQFERGISPVTGQPGIEKRSFDRTGVRQNGKLAFYQSVIIGIRGDNGQDAIHLSENVKEALRDVSRRQEFSNLSVHVVGDFAEGIEEQISSLQRSLLEGLAVVILVSFLLISWRASLTSAIAMITVLLITLAVLYITGNTLNTITLFALILSLGLIVDDTTIKVEAIDAAKHESRRKRDIMAIAARRVSLASAAGTLTTILGFAPMLFVGGVLGDFIRILPVTIIVSLALSLLISLVLVPLLSSWFILRKAPKASRNPIIRLEQATSSALSRLLLIGKASRKKGAIIGISILVGSLVVIAASGTFFGKLAFDIFPSTKDSDAIVVTVRRPPSTPLPVAEQIADEINIAIDRAIGRQVKRVSYRSTGSASEITISIDLISFRERDITSPELINRLQRSLQSFQTLGDITVSQLDVGPPAEDLPFRVQIDAEDNPRTAGRAADALAKFLENRKIKRPNGTAATITEAEIATPTQLTRIDGRIIWEVRAGFNANDTSALVTATQAVVEDYFTDQRLRALGIERNDIVFDFGSESENQDSFRSMLIALPILLVAMYVLMALQFKSLLQPLLIFSAIPYSFFGVAFGLHITNNPLSFFVLVGFFALIGIALNNTILLTDYANQARQEGMGRIDAVATAVQARFRPLLTTSITSVVALIPLAISDPFWESLSVTLIFGLLSSTFLVIVAFPYVYLAGEVLRTVGQRAWHRRLPRLAQYPFDLILAPFRVVHHLLIVIFRLPPERF